MTERQRIAAQLEAAKLGKSLQDKNITEAGAVVNKEEDLKNKAANAPAGGSAGGGGAAGGKAGGGGGAAGGGAATGGGGASGGGAAAVAVASGPAERPPLFPRAPATRHSIGSSATTPPAQLHRSLGGLAGTHAAGDGRGCSPADVGHRSGDVPPRTTGRQRRSGPRHRRGRAGDHQPRRVQRAHLGHPRHDTR